MGASGYGFPKQLALALRTVSDQAYHALQSSVGVSEGRCAEYHTLGAMKQQDFVCHSSGGWKCAIQVSKDKTQP